MRATNRPQFRAFDSACRLNTGTQVPSELRADLVRNASISSRQPLPPVLGNMGIQPLFRSRGQDVPFPRREG